MSSVESYVMFEKDVGQVTVILDKDQEKDKVLHYFTVLSLLALSGSEDIDAPNYITPPYDYVIDAKGNCHYFETDKRKAMTLFLGAYSNEVYNLSLHDPDKYKYLEEEGDNS